MSRIELLFGGPTSLKDEIEIEEDAYGWGISIEAAVIRRFRSTANRLVKTNKNGDRFFELIVFVETIQKLTLPKMSSGIYRHNGFVLPKLIIHDEYGIDQKSGEKVPLLEKHINAIGNGMEEHFGYEYFEYVLAGTSKPSSVPERFLG